MPDDFSSPATMTEPPPLPVLTGESTRISASNTPPKLWVATFAPLLLGGAGQMYNRQWAKGVVVLVVRFAFGYLAQSVAWGAIPLLLLLLAEMVDARSIAKKLRAGHTVGTWEFF